MKQIKRIETWHYDYATGLYYQDMVGIGLSFDELAERNDYISGHDSEPNAIIEFGICMNEDQI